MSALLRFTQSLAAAVKRSYRQRLLEAEFERTARSYDLPDRLSSDGLARWLERKRKRRIEFRLHRFHGQQTGEWTVEIDEKIGELVDVLLIEEMTTRYHQERIKRHELIHLLRDGIPSDVFSHLKVGSVAGRRTGRHKPDPEEAVVEGIAGQLQAAEDQRILTSSPDPDMQEMVDRLSRYYERRTGQWLRKT